MNLRRRPGWTLFTLAIVGTGLGFRHVAARMRENELAQKNIARNKYVSVDRSGGGV
jgi:hypothetical protein